MNTTKCFLSPPGVATAQGCSREALATHLIAGEALPLSVCGGFVAGIVAEELPAIADARFDLRVNRLALLCLRQIEEFVAFAVRKFSRSRVGIVVGNSNAGIAELEREVRNCVEKSGEASFDPRFLDLGLPAEFIKRHMDLGGPAYAVSVACSSAGKALAAAKRLIDNDVCDAVVAGGADSFSAFVQSGFGSLGLLSQKVSQPLATGRDGINIGEGAALFVLSRTPFPGCDNVVLAGAGESSDAYHLTSPQPDGNGAESAMRRALADAGISPCDIDYINLHGTGTQNNDDMECRAIARVFAEKIPPCSSSKPFLGHALGASGAIEAAVCRLALSREYNPEKILPPHPAISCVDPACAAIPLVKKNQAAGRLNFCLSNSFAFGGGNVSLILGKS